MTNGPFAAGPQLPTGDIHSPIAPQPSNDASDRPPSSLDNSRQPTLPRSFAQIATAPPPARPWIVDELIRESGSTVIAGPRNIGKSFFGLQLMEALAGATPFLEQFGVYEPVRALMVGYETDELATDRRWKLLTTGQEAPDSQYIDASRRHRVRVQSIIEYIDVGSRSSQRFNEAAIQPTLPDGRPELEHIIRTLGIRVLIIDPWAGFMSGNENSNDEVQLSLATLDVLRMRTGVSVVLVHHFGKEPTRRGSEPEDRWRGASRLADWPETRITLTPRDIKNLASRHDKRRWLDVTFMCRDVRPPDDQILEADTETRRFNVRDVDPDGKSQTQSSNSSRSKGPTVLELFEAVRDHGPFDSKNKLAQHFGISHNTLTKALDQAIKLGSVVEGKGKNGGISYTASQNRS